MQEMREISEEILLVGYMSCEEVIKVDLGQSLLRC